MNNTVIPRVSIFISCNAAFWVLAGIIASAHGEPSANVAWNGEGDYRIIASVAPVSLDEGRDEDELVAITEIDLSQIVPEIAQGAYIDLHSLQVMRLNSQTGEVEPYNNNAYQKSPSDRPFRYYDSALSDDYPTNRSYLSLRVLRDQSPFAEQKIPFGHRAFNPAVRSRRGKLAWMHTQKGSKSTQYAIYFNAVEASHLALNPPAGFIGDGSNRVLREYPNYAGLPGNNAGCLADWNNDGLHDFVCGAASGYLVVFQNTGTTTEPRFQSRSVLSDAEGKPIDVGYDAFPHVTDWNADGMKDLLIGAEKGCIAYYQNIGSDAKPVLKYVGLIQADEKPLITPNWPIAELEGKGRGNTFKEDYVAIPCAVDWDDDGDTDLLAGGFVTGLIFYFENVGRNDDGTPNLTARGLLRLDDTNEPIDTAWGAAPVAVDIDRDGDLDLICGATPVTPTAGGRNDPSANLLLFENVGTRKEPRLVARPFPSTIKAPAGGTLTVSVADWNHDGLLDLGLVARSAQLFLVPNVGSKRSPKFDTDVKPVQADWNNAQLPRGRYIDWDSDGHPDLLSGFTVRRNTGEGLPGFFTSSIGLLPRGQHIRHPVKHGDENPGIIVYDFDQDEDFDCIYGGHSGHIWLHRNRGSNAKPDWDLQGVHLRLSTGALMKVGLPAGVEPVKFDFTVLQGARPKLAAGDFSGDEVTDLVVSDTYGKVRLFVNVGTNEDPLFSEPKEIFTHANRLQIESVNWNNDGRQDLLLIMGEKVQLLESQAGELTFKEPHTIDLPRTLGGYVDVSVVDFNGDGDDDFIYRTSHRLTCFAEGSFLKHGYCIASRISVTKRNQ
jgi:hypothetical protein